MTRTIRKVGSATANVAAVVAEAVADNAGDIAEAILGGL